MATAVFDETSKNLKNSTQLMPESRNYSLNSSCENLRTRVTEKLLQIGIFFVWPMSYFAKVVLLIPINKIQ
jgi:hypothetical protein